MNQISQWLIILLLVLFAAAGNLFLKVGAGRLDFGNLPFGVLNWQLASGLCLFAFAFIFYVVLLRFVPLNLAQAFMALQFAATITAAVVVLGEGISALRLLGLSVILLGVVIVSFTQ